MSVVLAAIRPDAWNFPLLIHVAGAMVLVGSLVLAGSALIFAWRDRGGGTLVRLGYRSLLLGVVPGWIVMRAGAEWIASKEHLENSDVSWINIGFTTSDIGALLIIISTVLAGLAWRRAARDAAAGGSGLGRAATVLVAVLIVAYVVTLWAMTTKPS
ncbi:MAG TPA: hypothetical protein VE571_04635 [Solirubrobacteraceae bacterium]|nr:hypothetical protein [Solirubrobacteraceae bacterium]